jgi:hypothetical protein
MTRCLFLLLLPPLASAAEKPARSFTPPRRPAVPEIAHLKSAIRNPIDSFIFAKVCEKGLALSAEADRTTLLRRVTFDLTGFPPTSTEMDAFLKDSSPDAYEKVVERLLNSPAFGERMAGPWLDLVRYAESDGFKEDAHRPAAHRYRDWVIRAFNADLGYDHFVAWQLAGDELEPDNRDALTATGFLRLYPDEYNAANLEQRWQEILDDVTDVTGAAFLGLTVGCARCHDHKYDPTSQKDYFALQSFLAPMLPRDELPSTLDAAWEKASKPIRDEIDRLLAPLRADIRKRSLEKFRAEIQEAARTPPEKRTPYQEQIAALAEKQVKRAIRDALVKPPADIKKKLDELEAKLAAIPGRPHAAELVMAVSDVSRAAPPTHRLRGGNWKNPKEIIEPSFPEFLGRTPPDTHLPRDMNSTGRRSALARWLARPEHPLTARVVVNRLWQHHFGVGLVATSNDFGAAGDPSTHPELLDWLACELTGEPGTKVPGIGSPWSLKRIHRLIVTSATYRQSSRIDPQTEMHRKALAVDRDNKLLWHARRRRLEGEALRDAMLSLSGEVNRRMFGPSARPKLPEGLSKYAWKPDENEIDQNRRSIYVQARRNLRFPLFDVFDLPDMHNSCSRRSQTTTAPQALLLLNGELTRERTNRWAVELLRRHGDDLHALTAAAYRAAWSRPATGDEVRLGVDFIRKQADRFRSLNGGSKDTLAPAIADFCHAVVNSNEMLYVD